jgi:hypothetical protein
LSLRSVISRSSSRPSHSACVNVAASPDDSSSLNAFAIPCRPSLVGEPVESDTSRAQQREPMVPRSISHRRHHLAIRPMGVERVVTIFPLWGQNRVKGRQRSGQPSEAPKIRELAEVACGDHLGRGLSTCMLELREESKTYEVRKVLFDLVWLHGGTRHLPGRWFLTARGSRMASGTR